MDEQTNPPILSSIQIVSFLYIHFFSLSLFTNVYFAFMRKGKIKCKQKESMETSKVLRQHANFMSMCCQLHERTSFIERSDNNNWYRAFDISWDGVCCERCWTGAEQREPQPHFTFTPCCESVFVYVSCMPAYVLLHTFERVNVHDVFIRHLNCDWYYKYTVTNLSKVVCVCVYVCALACFPRVCVYLFCLFI